MKIQEDGISDTEATLPMAVQPEKVQPKAHQNISGFEKEAAARAQLGCYVRTGMFPVFKFPLSDEDFKIDAKPYKHYVELCSPLVGHILMGDDKNDYIMKKR
jgi:hypothetical protein